MSTSTMMIVRRESLDDETTRKERNKLFPVWNISQKGNVNCGDNGLEMRDLSDDEAIVSGINSDGGWCRKLIF